VAALRVVAVVLAAGAVTGKAQAADSALFFLFERTTARPGEQVTVRTAGTPAGFRQTTGTRATMRLYLVRNEAAGKVRSRFDGRLDYVGSLRPGRRGRALLRFVLPPLDSGRYAAAVWCPSCAATSRGRTFFVLGVRADTAARYRRQMLLNVAAPRATAERCPVTQPRSDRPHGPEDDRWYGNDKLWVSLPPGGVLRVAPSQVRPNGALFDKPDWMPTGVTGSLTVRGRRIDAHAPSLRVHSVNWGYNSTGRGSWRSAISYPTEGCWKLTGRVRDISISYVLKVERL
jgi:hypothetical protein